MKRIYKIILYISEYTNVFLASILYIVILFRYIKIKEQIHMVEYRNIMLEKNYQEIKNLYQNYMYTYHDIKNHLIVLQNYCNKGENKNAVKYIEKISKPILETKSYFISNNKVIDIILNYKFEEAKKKDIFIEAEIDKIGEISIDEADLCVILANLMDNAIEACQNIDKEKRWINVIIKKVEGMLLIDISNSCSQKRTSLNIKNSLSKDIAHGYGTKSVKTKVLKYGGTVKWGYKGNKYVANITFFNIFNI